MHARYTFKKSAVKDFKLFEGGGSAGCMGPCLTCVGQDGGNEGIKELANRVRGVEAQLRAPTVQREEGALASGEQVGGGIFDTKVAVKGYAEVAIASGDGDRGCAKGPGVGGGGGIKGIENHNVCFGEVDTELGRETERVESVELPLQALGRGAEERKIIRIE
jgi:hypothetical protein